MPGDVPLSTPRVRTSTQVHYFIKPSISVARRHHHYHHHYHHPRSKEKDHMPKEFKKYKPSTFDRDMKKVEDVESWLLGMKKSFRTHDYFENMKARVAAYNLRGKVDI